MDIERYRAAHKAGCLAVFRSNQAPYFAPDEYAEFERFLDHHTATSHYYVLLDGDTVAGCGGFGDFDGRLALTWGMVQRQAHRTGLGTKLLRFRLQALREVLGPSTVHIDTSQHTEGFFAKHGFHTTAVETDGFAPGLHKVSMRCTVA